MPPKQHTCWICHEVFTNARDMKNHMSSAIHSVLQVLCPFCPEEKVLKRSTPELSDHCKRYHAITMKENGLDSDFFKEANGFWMSTKPRDYRDLVKVSPYDSAKAEQARELVRRWLRRRGGPNYEDALKKWESNWRLQRKQPRHSSVESESRFVPDYETSTPPEKRLRREYDPGHPASTPIYNIQFIAIGQEVEAMLWAEGSPMLWYKISISKEVFASSKDLSSLCRRISLCKPAVMDPPSKFRPYADKKSKLRDAAAKTLGMSSKYISEIGFATAVEFEITPISTTTRSENNAPKTATSGGDADQHQDSSSINNQQMADTSCPSSEPPSYNNITDATKTDATKTANKDNDDPANNKVEEKAKQMHAEPVSVATENSTTPAPDVANTGEADNQPVATVELALSATNNITGSEGTCIKETPTKEVVPTMISVAVESSEPNESCPSEDGNDDASKVEAMRADMSLVQGMNHPPLSPVQFATEENEPMEAEESVLSPPSPFADTVFVHDEQSNFACSGPISCSVTSSPVKSSQPTTQNPNMLAKEILSLGCMPLCPPARRNWDREVQLTRGNVNLTWPPHKWRQMSPDQKLLQWEYASMRFEQEISDCCSLERGELLDKYNFLALPGSKIPPYDSPMRKARYYTYETLRTSPSAELLKQMLLAREARDTSVDDLIRTLNKSGVPLRL